MRTSKWITAAAAAGALAASGAAPASAADHHQGLAAAASLPVAGQLTSVTATSKRSASWAGYVALPKAGGASAFRYAAATITVPRITDCAAIQNAQIFHLAAIGGFTEQTLQGAGVDEGCSGGFPYYFATFWNGGYSDQFPVLPGDRLRASVRYTGANAQDEFRVADRSSGQAFDQTLTCIQLPTFNNACAVSSAEVITWGNLYTGAQVPDFGTAKFTVAQAAGSAQSTAHPLDSPAWTLYQLTLVGQVTGLADVRPSALTDTTSYSSFTNTWLRKN